MEKRTSLILAGLAALILSVGTTGCEYYDELPGVQPSAPDEEASGEGSEDIPVESEDKASEVNLTPEQAGLMKVVADAIGSKKSGEVCVSDHQCASGVCVTDRSGEVKKCVGKKPQASESTPMPASVPDESIGFAVETVFPAPGASTVSVDTKIKLIFANRIIKEVDINKISVNPAVSGLRLDGPPDDVASLLYDGFLSQGVTYHVTVYEGALTDDNGNRNQEYSWSFTTASGSPQSESSTSPQSKSSTGGTSNTCAGKYVLTNPQDLEWTGGPGGSEFKVAACKENQAIVAFQIWAGDWIDRLDAIGCRDINEPQEAINWIPVGAGGKGGDLTTLEAPDGHAMAGWRVHLCEHCFETEILEEFTFVSRLVSGSGADYFGESQTVGSIHIYDGSPPAAAGPVTCPPGYLLTQVRTWSGDALDRLGGECRLVQLSNACQ